MAFGVIDGKLYLNYNDTIRAQWLVGHFRLYLNGRCQLV